MLGDWPSTFTSSLKQTERFSKEDSIPPLGCHCPPTAMTIKSSRWPGPGFGLHGPDRRELVQRRWAVLRFPIPSVGNLYHLSVPRRRGGLEVSLPIKTLWLTRVTCKSIAPLTGVVSTVRAGPEKPETGSRYNYKRGEGKAASCHPAEQRSRVRVKIVRCPHHREDLLSWGLARRTLIGGLCPPSKAYFGSRRRIGRDPPPRYPQWACPLVGGFQ